MPSIPKRDRLGFPLPHTTWTHWPKGRCREGNACHKCPKTPSIGFCTIYRKQGTRGFGVISKRGMGPTSHLIPSP